MSVKKPLKDLYSAPGHTKLSRESSVEFLMNGDETTAEYHKKAEKIVKGDEMLIGYVKNPSEELLLHAVKNRYDVLQRIKHEYLSEKICLAAIKHQGGLAIRGLPKHLMTEKVCLAAVRRSHLAISAIDDPSEDVQLASVRANSSSIVNIKNPSDKVIIESLKKRSRNVWNSYGIRQSFSLIGSAPNNSKKIQDLIPVIAKHNPSIIKHLSVDRPDAKSVFMDAVSRDGMALKQVPNEAIDNDIIKAALNQNGYALMYVPYNLMSKSHCVLAVKQNPMAIKNIKDDKLLSEKMINDAVNRCPAVIKFIRNQNAEQGLKAVKFNPNLLEFVKNQTEEICLEAVNRDGLTLKFVKNRNKKISLAAFNNNKSSILYFDSKHVDEKILTEAIKFNFNHIKLIDHFKIKISNELSDAVADDMVGWIRSEYIAKKASPKKLEKLMIYNILKNMSDEVLFDFYKKEKSIFEKEFYTVVEGIGSLGEKCKMLDAVGGLGAINGGGKNKRNKII